LLARLAQLASFGPLFRPLVARVIHRLGCLSVPPGSRISGIPLDAVLVSNLLMRAEFDETALGILRCLPPAMQLSIPALSATAEALANLHRWKEALPIYEQILAFMDQDMSVSSTGGGGWGTLPMNRVVATASLADCHNNLGNLREAIRLYQEAFRTFEAAGLPKVALAYFELTLSYGDCLL